MVLSLHVLRPAAGRTKETTLATRTWLTAFFKPSVRRRWVLARRERAPLVRGLSCYFTVDSYLRGPADFKQVEPVGVPVVDDVGEFPPLFLPAPRHGGQRFSDPVRLSVKCWAQLPATLVRLE